MRTRPAIPASVLVLLALVPRVLFALHAPSVPFYPDEDAYVDIGRRIAEGLGHSQSFDLFDHVETGRPTAFWNFLFPVVVAGYRDAFGDEFVAYRIAQAVVGACLPPLVVALGLSFLDRSSAWLAGLICSLYPYFVYFSVLVVTEVWYLNLLYLGLAITFADGWRTRPLLRAALAGTVLALSCLTRSLTLYLLPVPLVFLALRRRHREAAVILATFAAASAPWIYRNTVAFGTFTLYDTKAGIQVYRFRDVGPTQNEHVAPVPPDLARENEGVKNREMTKRGLRLDLEQWETFLTNVYWKSRMFWSPVPNDRNARHRWLAIVTTGWLLPLGVAGSLLAARRDPGTWPLHAIVLLVWGISACTLGGTRQRLVIEPILLLFASHAIVAAGRRIQGSRLAAPAPGKA